MVHTPTSATDIVELDLVTAIFDAIWEDLKHRGGFDALVREIHMEDRHQITCAWYAGACRILKKPVPQRLEISPNAQSHQNEIFSEKLGELDILFDDDPLDL